MTDIIVLEGMEAVGKSTLLPVLNAALKAKGKRVESVREPGGTPLAERIRTEILLSKGAYQDLSLFYGFQICRAELLAYMRSRIPEVDVFVMDRFWPSTWAYQVRASHVSQALFNATLGALSAYLGYFRLHMFYLDCPEDVRQARMKAAGKGGDRYESKDAAFHAKVREGYEELVGTHMTRVDSSRAPEAVADEIIGQLAFA